MKKYLNQIGYWMISQWGARIRDANTDEDLGRAMVIAFGKRIWVIGYQGEKPLIPLFLAENKLSYWRQKVGFTTHQGIDFERSTEDS